VSALDGVILAGGRARRMGGVVKPMLEVGGRTLVARTVDAARRAGCERIVVAGPPLDDSLGVQWVSEDPPFGGPVAGLAAALALVEAEWTLVLPGDLAHPERAVAELSAATRAADGVCLVDEEGHRQWLTGIYRTEGLRRRTRETADDLRGGSVRGFLSSLEIAGRPALRGASDDIDTWDHLREARSSARAEMEDDMTDASPRTLPPEALDAWARALREHFGLEPEDLPISLVLDLAREVANGVARPAAPFSAFVAGLVAGRAGGTPDQVRDAVDRITRLAQDWDQS
jgi:molybdopterin-guanine dinucleotide biosynthesis protein A